MNHPFITPEWIDPSVDVPISAVISSMDNKEFAVKHAATHSVTATLENYST
jgi:hypothetical protein